jgi:hypothetical protein
MAASPDPATPPIKQPRFNWLLAAFAIWTIFLLAGFLYVAFAR